VLLQDGHPIAYESRKLIPAEQRYSVADRELLAVVHALKVWRCYLQGPDFTLITDHKPLVHLNTQPHLSGRQARWQEFLSRFHFTWQYRKGSSNMADALSRHPSLAVITANLSSPEVSPPELGESGFLLGVHTWGSWEAACFNLSKR
jgi:hypothetical protein